MMLLLVLIFIVLFILGAPIAVSLGMTSLINIELFETEIGRASCRERV